jgi:hypothetical protein
MTYFFRADGSLRITCRHRKEPGAALQACEQFGPAAGPSRDNTTDIASWRVTGGRICWHRTKNERELCFFVHEENGPGYVRHDGERRVSCLEGEISFN